MPSVVHLIGLDQPSERRLIDELRVNDAIPIVCAGPDQVEAPAHGVPIVVVAWTGAEDFGLAAQVLERRTVRAEMMAFLPERDYAMAASAFRAGAQDVLAAPVEPGEVARVQAAHKRRLAKATQPAPVRSLQDLEREAIATALNACRGQVSQTARRLGIGRSTLYRKIDQYGLINVR